MRLARTAVTVRADTMGKMSDLFAELQHALGDEFALERETSSTAIARVFIARERICNRSVLVSVLAPAAVGDLDFDRFVSAAERTAALDHPGIIPPLALGAAAGLPYIITPYVPGVTLRTRLTEKPPLALEEIVAVLRDVAIALDYAHARAAIHFQITPDQILLSQKAARLSDFGIEHDLASAQQVQPAALPRLTGSRACLAPEQFSGSPTPDHQADFFALGCVAYEMLTGAPPFDRDAALAAGQAPLDVDPPPIALTRRDVPATLARLVMRCLSIDPANRPATAANIVQLLETVDVSERAIAERALTPAYVPTITRQVTAQQPVQSAPTVRQRLNIRRVAPIAAAAVVGLSLLGWAIRRPQASEEAAPPPPPRPTVIEQSVVVLPMVVAGGDGGARELGLGLSDELARGIARSGARVIGRLSAAVLRDRSLDPRRAARELGAASVLAGTLTVTGDTVRLSVSLNSASDAQVRWSQDYVLATADLFSVTNDIAARVAAAARGAAVDTGTIVLATETRDPLAHLLVLQGFGRLQQLRSDALAQAMASFEQAIARDPSYARAHAGLALATVLAAPVTGAPGVLSQDRAIASATRAIAIDSTLAEAHQALAFARLGRGENRDAERSFRRSLALDSTLALGWSGFGLLANHIGDFAAARSRLARARRLDPALRQIDAWTAQVALGEGKPDRAELETRSVLAADSTAVFALSVRVDALIALDRAADAVALLDRGGAGEAAVVSEQRAMLAYACARAGQKDRARELMLAMRDASGGVLPAMATLAATLAALGDVDSAVSLLGKAAARRDPTLVLFSRGGRFETLSRDVRGADVFAGLDRW